MVCSCQQLIMLFCSFRGGGGGTWVLDRLAFLTCDYLCYSSVLITVDVYAISNLQVLCIFLNAGRLYLVKELMNSRWAHIQKFRIVDVVLVRSDSWRPISLQNTQRRLRKSYVCYDGRESWALNACQVWWVCPRWGAPKGTCWLPFQWISLRFYL